MRMLRPVPVKNRNRREAKPVAVSPSENIDVITSYSIHYTKLYENGVLALLSDSTNAERPGFTPSEKNVGIVLDDIFSKAEQRVVVATFASNVHRIQQVIDAAYTTSYNFV